MEAAGRTMAAREATRLEKTIDALEAAEQRLVAINSHLLRLREKLIGSMVQPIRPGSDDPNPPPVSSSLAKLDRSTSNIHHLISEADELVSALTGNL